MLCSCKKNSSANIEIQGRVLNFWDKSPIPCQIQLWVGSSTPGSKGTTNYGNYMTNADGTFDIKSNTQWMGTDYTLLFIPTDGNQSQFTEGCSVSNNKNLNIGDILTGMINVSCNIKINSVSSASINFINVGSTPQTNFPAGTSTVFTASFAYSASGYQALGNFYPFKYRISSSTVDSTIMVPLLPPAVTCSVTINY
ncbi:MAG: hypothetical protein ABI388_00700 [Bacteroidia bacterium]